ncbi:MAG TPA: NmrA family NAD(P)-binding protein [Labilithrix sp.]|nr:NmrA family NAD(P)-binding protein [Labilithrix sp.]
MSRLHDSTPAEVEKILVTGAVGNVGREVVRALVARGASVRGVDLSADAVRAMHGEGVEAERLDYESPLTFGRALDGCSSLFLVRPPAIVDMEATLLPFVDAALARGIEHIVFLSVLGAASSKLVPHHAVEVHLAERGASYTLLRPAFFSQNLGTAYRADIANDGRLFLPAARGRVAFVDIRDVAELAAIIFEDPLAHRGAAYTCTGPEALSFEETARLMTDVVRRPIRYESASIGGYVRHLHGHGLPLPQIAVQTVLHVGLRFGQLEKIDPTLERLLGRRPRTLATYVRESVDLWAPPPAKTRVA